MGLGTGRGAPSLGVPTNRTPVSVNWGPMGAEKPPRFQPCVPCELVVQHREIPAPEPYRSGGNDRTTRQSSCRGALVGRGSIRRNVLKARRPENTESQRPASLKPGPPLAPAAKIKPTLQAPVLQLATSWNPASHGQIQSHLHSGFAGPYGTFLEPFGGEYGVRVFSTTRSYWSHRRPPCRRG